MEPFVGFSRILLKRVGYVSRNADQIVHTYTAMVTGLSLDLLVTPKTMDRNLAKQVCHHYFVAVFPGHFESH